ncbi:FHIPEP family type III secretion protein, partial [Escherichia coli]|uniref:FHIPEP family type III secretion protein n=1 Tax=Escherichia coli TaxID=562 RepID=UPI001485BBAF
MGGADGGTAATGAVLSGVILCLLFLSMMVLPLPAFILDLLFTFNIALSIMVLLVAMFT